MTSALRPDAARRWLVVIACAFLAHVVYLNCVAEDAFIALRFANNLARGHGLVWNPGTPPVEGYTDFLWVILCAGAIAIGAPAVALAQAMSVAAGLATLALTYMIGRDLLHWPPAVALVPPGLLALSGPFATWSSSGMESTLFTFCIVVAARQFALFWRDGRSLDVVSGSVALLLSSLTRPEGTMIAATLVGLSAAAVAVGVRRRFVGLTIALVVYVVGFGAYFAWRYSRYGYLLPNTFYAKTGGGVQQVLRGGLLAYLFLMQFAVPLVPGALLTAWETGAAPLRTAWRTARAEWFERQGILVIAATICVVYTTYNVLVGGDYMAMHRFFVPVLPFMYLLFGSVIAPLHRRVSTPANAFGYSALLTCVALATLFPSTPLERSFFASPPQQHGNYRGVQIERWHVARLTAIGRFFNTYRRDAAESLATTAIGAIGYYADLQIHDIHGLVDTYIAHMPAPPDLGLKRAGHGRMDLRYTFSLNPTYVMFSRDLTPKPIELWRYVPDDLRPAVEQQYVHRSVWLTDERNDERGYFTFFERRDSAERRQDSGA